MSTSNHDILVLVAAGSVNTGPVKGILQFIQNINETDINFHLFNFWRINNPVPDPFEQETLKLGIPCNFIRMGHNNYPLMVMDAVRAVKSRNISIIQTHGYKPSFIGFCIKHLCGIRWICFMHGTTAENRKTKLYNFMDCLFQRFADQVVLVSESQRSKVPGGSDIRRVSVIHNSVDINRPVSISEKVESTRKLLKVPDNACLLAVVGRLSPEKGVDVFIDAFCNVLSVNKHIYAVIVGDGQEKVNLLAQAADKNCMERIFFVGHSSTPGDFMSRADIIVIPSRSEGIPNVALEAMALGKPVIATSVGGTPEIIEHEKSGLLVPTEQPEAMANEILRLINDPNLAERLSKCAHLRVKEHFSVESRCNKLVELYRSKKRNNGVFDNT
jgi:glycosyltransferase involved in cell wall biosynthesis